MIRGWATVGSSIALVAAGVVLMAVLDGPFGGTVYLVMIAIYNFG